MTSICLFPWVAALVLLPLIVLWWATESKPQRIHRLHRQYGWSQRCIVDHLGITRWQVRMALPGGAVFCSSSRNVVQATAARAYGYGYEPESAHHLSDSRNLHKPTA